MRKLFRHFGFGNDHLLREAISANILNDDDSGWEEDEIGQEQRIFENLIDKPLKLIWTNDA